MHWGGGGGGGVSVYGARRNFRNEGHLTKILLYNKMIFAYSLPSQLVSNQGILLKILNVSQNIYSAYYIYFIRNC